MFKLILINGDPAGAEFVLKPGENIIGRSRSTDIKISAMDVSGRHTRVLVEDGQVLVENMSQYGTFVDDGAVESRVEINPGCILKIGKSTEMRLEIVDESPAASIELDEGSETGEAPAGDEGAATVADAELTAASASVAVEASDFDDNLTMDAGIGSYDDEEGATRAMHTRAATPDEIQILKDSESKRAKRKLTTIISVVVVLLALGVIFRPRRPPPEIEIEWTKNKKGGYQHLFEPGISGGRDQGHYDLRYPDNGTFKRSDVVGGYMFSGFVGRDLDVPVRIILQEELDLRLASMTRAQIVADWIEMSASSGGVWRFNKPSKLAVFFGDKNGIPYTRVTYLRDEAGSWFGVASVFRHGNRRIVVRAEAPAVEQVRVENLLSSRMIYVADELQFSYWPYIANVSKLSVQEGLAEARHDLERMAPGTWMSLDKLLCGLLSRAVPQQDLESETECLRLLAKLRKNEALWFNSQQLSFESYKFRGDMKMARKVSVFTKGVFSEMSDQRYYTVRKWNLEP